MASVQFSHELNLPNSAGAIEPLSVFHGADDSIGESIQNDWTPILKAAADQLALEYLTQKGRTPTDTEWFNLLASKNLQDYAWNWKGKILASEQEDSLKFIHIRSEKSLESIMQYAVASDSILPANNGKKIVYVDYVSVAPWNRKQLVNPSRFRHVGTLMLRLAVTASFDNGLDGLCGLHSLPQAEGFYTAIGMLELPGSKSESGLAYFEFTKENAKKFAEGDI